MKKYFTVEAKELGYGGYDFYYFNENEASSKAEAMSKFTAVTKYTKKNNGEWYPYTAYEFDGKIYYSINYLGCFTEAEIRENGYPIDYLD